MGPAFSQRPNELHLPIRIESVAKRVAQQTGRPLSDPGRQHAWRLMQEDQLTIPQTTAVIVQAETYAYIMMHIDRPLPND